MHNLALPLTCLTAITIVSSSHGLAQKPQCPTGYAKAHKQAVGGVQGRAHYCIDREGRRDGAYVVLALDNEQQLASATYDAGERVGEY